MTTANESARPGTTPTARELPKRYLVMLRATVENQDMDESAFWSKVDRSGGADACWPWMGYRYPTGYGRSSQVGGRSEYAHRKVLSLVLSRALGSDEFACHHCDNPPCCNPGHLFLGTAKDNAQDRNRKGRDRWTRGYRNHTPPPLKSHCRNGHPYSDDNVVRWADGGRRCRTCIHNRHAA